MTIFFYTDANKLAFADVKSSYKRTNALPKVNKIKELTEDELNLEPLCKNVEIFSHKKKKELVSCKYKDISKKFRQECDTEKILYGLDDIEGESDIIIVEGEMDKLAMEEVGFRNCVSVPDGAPPKSDHSPRGGSYIYLCDIRDK
ncbi:primase homolog protein-like [Lactuca sativa]|uniref:primase homolog protein-like n=1 Tax=Lactuca sativa TaxID=4236 RepID=UPI000CD8DB33|nr:primase homolog protein-like [Lactuca sativa]